MTIPRRNHMEKWTDAERAIYDAIQVVEAAGAHPLLTEAVVLLGQAKDKVADFVDLPPPDPRDAQIAQLKAEVKALTDQNQRLMREIALKATV